MDKSALEPDWYIGWQTLSAIFALKTSVPASMSPDTKDLFCFYNADKDALNTFKSLYLQWILLFQGTD